VLTPGQQEAAATAFERLAQHNVSLNTVVSDWLARHDLREKSVTLKRLCDAFIEKKTGRSKAYRTALHYTAKRFAPLHQKKVCDIEPNEIDRLTNSKAPAARNSDLRILKAIFNFGIRRGWLEKNPIVKIDFDEIKRSEVVTLSPRQAQALMAAADYDLIPYFSLGLFAGIRPDELKRLDWENINLSERHITITPGVSKTSHRRIIDIEPNLLAWLNHFIACGGKTVGKVTPRKNLRSRLRSVRATSVKHWVQDSMRHSYASYWLAQNGDINRLTLQLGHTSPTMLWKHYHRASTKKDAAFYWSITPADVKGKIVPMAV
jgi:integrase